MHPCANLESNCCGDSRSAPILLRYESFFHSKNALLVLAYEVGGCSCLPRVPCVPSSRLAAHHATRSFSRLFDWFTTAVQARPHSCLLRAAREGWNGPDLPLLCPAGAPTTFAFARPCSNRRPPSDAWRLWRVPGILKTYLKKP